MNSKVVARDNAVRVLPDNALLIVVRAEGIFVETASEGAEG